MSSPFFRFKQFTVWHDKCAMKVGTDGVLLGAWAFPNAECVIRDTPCRILDIGTGTGLIALMLAQRWSNTQDTKGEEDTKGKEFSILGIDIDEAAAQQAQENFAASPWNSRLSCRQIALQELNDTPFDYIISNPPYFVDSLRNPDPARQTARHTDTLSYQELLRNIERLLKVNGSAAIILPAETEHEILDLAATFHLYPIRLTHICSKPGRAPKRILLEFSHSPEQSSFSVEHTTLYIESACSPRSEEYAELTKDFYL